MKKAHIFILTIVIVILAVVLLAVFAGKQANKDTNPVRTVAVQAVADFLTQSGAKFYGASWCPHCADQKAFFGKAVKSVPYIECSTGGAGTPQTQICIDNKIERYPTWIFANGTKTTLVIAPIDLADILNQPIDDASKAELNIQKDEFFKTMTPEQVTEYIKQVAETKEKVNKK